MSSLTVEDTMRKKGTLPFVLVLFARARASDRAEAHGAVGDHPRDTKETPPSPLSARFSREGSVPFYFCYEK
jgi:hypothetical protein